jgi:hypothetical protein
MKLSLRFELYLHPSVSLLSPAPSQVQECFGLVAAAVHLPSPR